MSTSFLLFLTSPTLIPPTKDDGQLAPATTRDTEQDSLRKYHPGAQVSLHFAPENAWADAGEERSHSMNNEETPRSRLFLRRLPALAFPE
jgi:hypothetical protein